MAGEYIAKKLKEVINYTHSSAQLKDKEVLNFEDCKEKYVSVQGEGIYLYDKADYNLGMIRYFYKQYLNENLIMLNTNKALIKDKPKTLIIPCISKSFFCFHKDTMPYSGCSKQCEVCKDMM